MVERTGTTASLNDNVRLKWEPGDTNTDRGVLQSSVASVMKSENYTSDGDTLAQTSCRYNVGAWGDSQTRSAPLPLQYES